MRRREPARAQQGAFRRCHDDDYLKRLIAVVKAKPKPSPLTLVPDAYLDELGTRDRRVLCAWADDRVFRLPTLGGSDFGLRSLDGAEEWVGGTLAWYECMREPFGCHRKLSEVLPCEERALVGDPGFFAPDARQCRGQAECIWGFTVARAPWIARP